MYDIAQQRKLGPWQVILIVLAITIVLLRRQGRVWWCACGRANLWSGSTKSSHNSQHLFDPYSFTHLLHGVTFYGLLAWAFPRLSWVWRLSLAVTMESLWEVVENSESVIQRYREATLARGYKGDSIGNSLGDILCCATGFTLARQLGFGRSLVVFAGTEVALALWIRDNLTLNVVMLLYPIDAIKAWQTPQEG